MMIHIDATMRAAVIAVVSLQTVTMVFDWGRIAEAFGPSFLVFTTAVAAYFTYKRARKADKEERERADAVAAAELREIKKIGHDTHVLVNDQLTREKATRLLDARTNKAVLAKLLGDDLSVDDTALLKSLESQIKGLATEIRQRDAAAGTLIPNDPMPGGQRSDDPPDESGAG